MSKDGIADQDGDVLGALQDDRFDAYDGAGLDVFSFEIGLIANIDE